MVADLRGARNRGQSVKKDDVFSGPGSMERLLKSSVMEKLWDMAVAHSVRLTISVPASRAGPWFVPSAFSEGDSLL